MDEKNPGTNKNLLIILGIIAIIVIVGLVIYSQYGKLPETPGETEESSPEVTEEPVVQTQEEIDKLLREAIDTQDASVCEKLSKEGDKEFCKTNVIVAEATVKRDANICNQLEDENVKAGCKDNVITGQAMDAKDPSICEAITDETRKEQCKDIATR